MNNIEKTNDANPKEYHGVQYLLKLAWQLKYWILLSVAILLVAAFVILKNITPQYERQLALRIEPQQTLCEQDTCAHDVLLSQISLRDETEPIRTQLRSSSLLDSAEIHSQFENQLSLERKTLSASSLSKSSYIIYLKCKTENPKNADAFLMALAESYNQYTIQQQKKRLEAMISNCDNMINLLVQNSVLPLDSLNDVQAFIYSKIKNDDLSTSLIKELENRKVEYYAEYLQISPMLSIVDVPLNSDVPVYPKSKFFYLLAALLGIFIPLFIAEIVYSRKNRNFAD